MPITSFSFDDGTEVRYVLTDTNFKGVISIGRRSTYLKYNRYVTFSAKEWDAIIAVFGNEPWEQVTRLEFSGQAYDKCYVIYDCSFFVGARRSGDNEFVTFSKEEWRRIMAAFPSLNST